MRAICPECKKLQPVGGDDRMLDHPDPYGTFFSCEGVGQESGIVVLGKKIKSKSRDSSFDRETGDEDSPDSSCGVVGLPVDKEAFQFVPVDSVKSKPGLFGSIGDQINLKKLSQKERKARK